MSDSGRAARNGAVTLLGQWLRFVIQAAGIIVLARILSPSAFGSVAMVSSIAGIAYVLGDMGLSLAGLQAANLTAGVKSALFTLNVGAGVAFAVAFAALSGPLAAFYDQPDVASVAVWLAPIFLLNGLATQPKVELARRGRYGTLSAVDVASQALGLGVAIAVALSGGGLWSLVGQQLAVSGFSVLGILLASRWRPVRPTFRPAVAQIKFGADSLAVQLINYGSSNVDNVMVGKFFGPEALGFYSRAYQLFTLPLTQVMTPLTRVVLPLLSNLPREVFASRFRRLQLQTGWLVCGAFVLAIGSADPLVRITLGDEWSSTVPIFRVLALGGCVQSLTYLYYWAMLAHGLTRLQLKLSVASRVAMIGAIFVGAQFSPVGVAIGAVTGLVILLLAYTTFALPRLGLARRPVVLLTARIIAVAVVPSSVNYVVNAAVAWSPWVEILVNAGVACVVLTGYFAGTATGRADLDEVRSVTRVRRAMGERRASVGAAPVSGGGDRG